MSDGRKSGDSVTELTWLPQDCNRNGDKIVDFRSSNGLDGHIETFQVQDIITAM